MTNQLNRSLNLLQATAINMIDMVGIGPFVVLPLVIQMMAGPNFIYAWILGALISIIDGMIWSELGAASPLAGGSYNFLRESYGKEKWGRLMSFLYVWQTMIQAPLVIASGAIGFSQYFSYLVPLDTIQKKIVSGSLVILITFLIYRNIKTIGKISVFLWAGVIITLLWLIIGGITHGHWSASFSEPGSLALGNLSFVVLGQASVKTIYSYLGYYNVCHLGGEIKNPEKNIPRSIFISIAGISVLYLAMNLSVVSVIPWQEAQHSEFIVSTFVEKIYGSAAANFATGLVLWIALASLFAVMLGYSRVPYAAANDKQFFPVFAKRHPTKNFPHISVLFLGITAFVFSLLFKLADVITGILAMRIVIQFIGQAAGVIILRKKNGTAHLPFKMPFFPLPVILAIVIWGFIFISTGTTFMLYGLIVIILGIIAFLIFKMRTKEWPFTVSKRTTYLLYGLIGILSGIITFLFLRKIFIPMCLMD